MLMIMPREGNGAPPAAAHAASSPAHRDRGLVRLDDGRWIEIDESDRLFGSAEAVENHW